MYRVHAAGASIHLEPVAIEIEALDPRFVFVIDCGTKIYLWQGRKSKNTLKSKSRYLLFSCFVAKIITISSLGYLLRK